MAIVSIILPTYNRARLLRRAVDSVLAQTFTDFELIVVDDGSTDDTGRVLDSYADARLRVIHLPHNAGAAEARNAGIEASEAPYVTFQDSDDEWLPHKLARQMAVVLAGQTEFDVVYSAFWRLRAGQSHLFPPLLRRLSRHIPTARYRLSGDIYRALSRGNVVQSPLVKRHCFDRSGLFDPAFPRWHDWELWLRLATEAQFHFIPEPLFKVYFTPESITRNSDALATSLERFRQKYRRELAHNADLAAHILFTEGNLLWHTGRQTEGRRRLRSALAHNLLNPFHALAYLAAWPGSPIYRPLVRRLGISYGIGE